MREYASVKEAQNDILIILKEFHRICEKNGIKYTLDGGTLLGAARHKGFIPWDDDADVCMLRKEYKKFLKCAKKELNQDLYELDYLDHPKYYSYNFAKLKLKNTYFPETETSNTKENQGIWIDIFPMDNTTKTFYKFQSKAAYFLQTIRWRKNGRFFKTNHKKLVSFLSILMPYFLINALCNFFLRFLNIFKTKNVCKLCHFGKNKTPHSRTYYLNLDKCLFEDAEFYVIQSYEEWLNLRYGDWKRLPPESERHPQHGF